MGEGRTHKRTLATLVAAGLVVIALFAAGCGVAGAGSDKDPAATTTEPAATTTTTASTETTSSTAVEPTEDQAVMNVYFGRGDKLGVAHRSVPKTEAVAQAAITELLAGPTPAESDAGLTTAIPDGTELLDVNIDGGVATVDLTSTYETGGGSLSMFMRLAQVVYTATQFESVDSVVFRLDGEPVTVFSGEGILLEQPQTRANYEDVTPAILVESVAPGDSVKSPVRLTGTANTFEATFMITITDWDGLIVAEEFATATSGSGTRGAFDVTVPFKVEKAGVGAVIVWEASAKDGSQINVVEIPVQIVK